MALFVISTVGPKQNVGSLLKPASDTVFYAVSHGTLGVALHGSFFNHFLIIGENLQPANRNFCNRRLLELPWRKNVGYRVKEHKNLCQKLV